jgi:hypothetical protein
MMQLKLRDFICGVWSLAEKDIDFLLLLLFHLLSFNSSLCNIASFFDKYIFLGAKKSTLKA